MGEAAHAVDGVHRHARGRVVDHGYHVVRASICSIAKLRYSLRWYRKVAILSKTMSAQAVALYANEDGCSPVVEWMDTLPSQIQDKCIVRIERLEKMGKALAVPECWQIKDAVYEMRVKTGALEYSILYFFAGEVAVIAHGCERRSDIPDADLAVVLNRQRYFCQNPEQHTYKEEL